tara:strand:- start:1575 stop:2345 length:771 start_codon:yes stop_codon:yes gene_type:complete
MIYIIIIILFLIFIANLINKKKEHFKDNLKNNNKEQKLKLQENNSKINLPEPKNNNNSFIKKKKRKKKIEFKIGCSNDSDCNIVYGDGKNVCKLNNECYCVSGTGKFCHLGPTNFKDPKLMTDKEKEHFINNYSKEKFTLEDYKNWLILHKNDLSKLSGDHLKNFNNINNISLKDIPRTKISPPLNSEEYFNKMYKNNLEFIKGPKNSDTAGIVLASNFDQFSEFIPPKSIKNGILYSDFKHNAVAIDQCYLKLSK